MPPPPEDAAWAMTVAVAVDRLSLLPTSPRKPTQAEQMEPWPRS